MINATYAAAGLATLFYAANTYLIQPMLDSLTESRHDLASHSQSKLDDFNDRLSKLVSKLPEPKSTAREEIPEIEVDEASSTVSDPTELYHRDMGTQTSPLPTRRASTSSSSDNNPFVPPESARTKDPITYQTNGLDVLRSHLDDLSTGFSASKTAAAPEEAFCLLPLRNGALLSYSC